MVKQYWWKALGVAIVLYTIFMGLLVPLKPGLISVEPPIIESGKPVSFVVEGYNTNFSREKSELKAWLVRRDGTLLSPKKVEVSSETKLKLDFSLPAATAASQAVDTLQLILDSPGDGHIVSTVDLKNGSENTDSMAIWQVAKVKLHKKTGTTFPFLNNIYESARNLYYHVPMWMAMFILGISAAVLSASYLFGHNPDRDLQANALSKIAMLYGVLGVITGAIWAKNTWGEYWSNDPKQVYTAIGLLIYGAYFVLRASFEDPEKKARISSVYNIFAFATLLPLMYIMPKLSADSNHPGTGSNIAFGKEDLDNTMRMVFYPAIIGWALMGVWLGQISFRFARLRERWLERD